MFSSIKKPTKEEMLEAFQEIVAALGDVKPVTRLLDPDSKMVKESELEGAKITIFPPDQFLDKLALPKDCQAIACSQIAAFLAKSMNDKDSIEELFPLQAMYAQKTMLLGYNVLEKQKNILEEWIEKKAKYAKDKKIIDAIERSVYFLYLLQSSKKMEK